MDGDLDLIVGVRGGGAGGAAQQRRRHLAQSAPFAGVVGRPRICVGRSRWRRRSGCRARGRRAAILHVFMNRQAGQFRALPGPPASKEIVRVALGDVNADGVLDLVTLDSVRRDLRGVDLGRPVDVAADSRPGARPAGKARHARFWPTSTTTARSIWSRRTRRARPRLAGGRGSIVQAAGERHRRGRSVGVADLNSDGQLDLVGLVGGRAVRLLGRGTRGYHWQVVRPRAQRAAGDQRINRSASAARSRSDRDCWCRNRSIAGPAVHFGLGTRTAIDVTRIVWPNGVPQAEFDPPRRQPLVAEQRLKGSCPWVFADNGKGMQFVTDFLWRSPLGLRINAQDTAGSRRRRTG